jgi:DNA-binding transcriptional MerR regulator/methylmalonyl-CoA mutase cobalamin-binding subunit
VYTIKEASSRTGVGVPLIRAWERRYGVVAPARTASGYRLYDDASIRTLLAMRSLLASGWTASEAARAIGAGEVDVADLAAGVATATSGGSPGPGRRAELIERFVTAAAAANTRDTEAALDEMFTAGSFETVIDDLVLPAAAALGDAWSADRLSVAAEHAASSAITRRLAAVYQAAGVPRPSSVVVGLAPGARHELGALAFATALRRTGTGVLYLGQDVTVDGWVDAITRTRARAAVLGAVTESEAAAAAPVAEALRSAGVPLVAIGGAGASEELAQQLGVVRLPARVVDAAGIIATAVRRRR